MNDIVIHNLGQQQPLVRYCCQMSIHIFERATCYWFQTVLKTVENFQIKAVLKRFLLSEILK